MNVWEVVFELSWDWMKKGEFDEKSPECVVVVADSYDGALETAKQVASAESYFDEDDEKDVFVKDIRLIEIKRGQSVDAIAKMTAQA